MNKADNSLVEAGAALPQYYGQSRSGNSTRAADKQKVTDQNSLSESEQHPVALGLVRLQEATGKKSVVALQAKQMEHHAVLFLYFSVSSAFG